MTKKETLALIFIFLLALTCISFAQQTQVEATAAQSQYELIRDWRVLAGITVLVMSILVAMAYAAGVGLENSELQAWASTELVQVFVTAIIVMAFAGVITFLDDMTVMVIQNSNLPFTCDGAQNCAITTASQYLANMQDSAENQVIGRISDSVKAGKMASYRAGAYATQVLMPIPLLQLSVSGSITAGYIMDIDRDTALIEQLGSLLSVMYAQRFFIEQISYNIAPIVLVLGVVARSFFLTRRLGGLLMAIGIGVMYVLPLMYVLNWITLSLTLYGDSIITPNLGACPGACALSPPKFYLQNNEPVYDKDTMYNYLGIDTSDPSQSGAVVNVDRLENGSMRLLSLNGQTAYSCEYAALTGATMSGQDSAGLSPTVSLPETSSGPGAAVAGQPSAESQPVVDSAPSSGSQTASLAADSQAGTAASAGSAWLSGSGTISLLPPNPPPGDVDCTRQNCEGTNSNCWCGGVKITTPGKYCCGADDATFTGQLLCQQSTSCRPIYACSSSKNRCQSPVSSTCHCGATDATAGQYCCASGNAAAADLVACQNSNTACYPSCPSSQNRCQSIVTQNCWCGGTIATAGQVDQPFDYCNSGASFVSEDSTACFNSLPLCSTSYRQCQAAVPDYCRCGTMPGLLAQTGRFCYASTGRNSNVSSSQTACQAHLPTCSNSVNQCQGPVGSTYCRCGSQNHVAGTGQYCYATGNTIGTFDQCAAALPSCPSDASRCERTVTSSCKCGSAIAFPGQYCFAAGNVSGDSSACVASLPNCTSDVSSCGSGVPASCKCNGQLASAGKYCCAADASVTNDQLSCQANYDCMPACGSQKCESTPGQPCRCGPTAVDYPGSFCCGPDNVVGDQASCLESYSCMPNCQYVSCEQPSIAKCWCPSIGTTSAVKGQFCCGAASTAGPPTDCLQTPLCMPAAPYGNCEQALDASYRCGSAEASAGEFCCAGDSYHTYTQDFCKSSPSCAAPPTPVPGGYCPYECRELPYPMGPTCTGTILVNGQNQTAEQTKKACAKLPQQCKITRLVDLNAYPEPLQPSGGNTNGDQRRCPQVCQTIPPLKSNCDATKAVSAFVASGSNRDKADSVPLLADCLKAKDFCFFTQDNSTTHDLSVRPDGCMVDPNKVYDSKEQAQNVSYGMACESPPADSIIASESCVYVLPSQDFLDSGVCDSCLFVQPEYTLNPPVYTDCAARCGGGANAGPPKINPAEFAQRTAEGMVGRPEIKSVAALMLPAYILPLLDILVTLMFIRSFSAMLGGDIEIPGLTRII